MNKKRLQKGETLTETLAAILISALSSALLLTAVMTSSKVNKQTEEADLALREQQLAAEEQINGCLLYTSPSPRDVEESRMPSSA